MKTENLGVKRSLLWLCPGPLSGAAGRHSPTLQAFSWLFVHTLLHPSLSCPLQRGPPVGILLWFLQGLGPSTSAALLLGINFKVPFHMGLFICLPASPFPCHHLHSPKPRTGPAPRKSEKKILNEGNMTVSSHFVSNPTRR